METHSETPAKPRGGLGATGTAGTAPPPAHCHQPLVTSTLQPPRAGLVAVPPLPAATAVTERTGTPARLGFPEGREEKTKEGGILGGDGAAGSEELAGMEGGAPAAGTEGTGGDRGGSEGGPSAWSWELPARLDSRSSSQPRGFGKPRWFFFSGHSPKRELQRLVLL